MSQAHFRTDSSQVPEIARAAKARGVRCNVVKKDGSTHVFVPLDQLETNSLIELINTGARAPERCAGCGMCARSGGSGGNNSGGNGGARKQRYALYPPLVLLPTGTAPDAATTARAAKLLEAHPECTHVAINAPIRAHDVVRRPQIVPVVGDFGTFCASAEPSAADLSAAFWATCVQNRIFQTWAPMYTMFSRGNVTEKARVLASFAQQEPIAGTAVVDLYAGIGYFALPYAAQRAARVYCWELNPWSVEGLARACRANGVSVTVVRAGEPFEDTGAQLVVFAEDNQRALGRVRELDLARVSHINMGLLPDARDAFAVAKRLASARTVFHVHENVRAAELATWRAEMAREFGACLHVEKIKEYAPGVLHVCGDFRNGSPGGY